MRSDGSLSSVQIYSRHACKILEGVVKKAYLLIDIDNNVKASQVAEALRSSPRVIFADAVTGPHDVIAVLEGGDVRGQGLSAVSDIKALKGIRYITACFAVRTEFGNDYDDVKDRYDTAIKDVNKSKY